MQKLDKTQLPANEAWAGVPYAAGWTDYDATEWFGGQYYRDPFGRVFFRGLIKNATGSAKASVTIVGTMPAGYRPTRKVMFVALTAVGAQRFTVYTNGQLAWEGASLPANEWISLASVSYLAEQ